MEKVKCFWLKSKECPYYTKINDKFELDAGLSQFLNQVPMFNKDICDLCLRATDISLRSRV